MCGIFAVSSKNQDINNKLFVKSLATLNHRGPDDSKIFKDQYISLGFTRLAIQDLNATGAQPMCDKNGNCLIFNGEIYNFKEIKKSLIEEGIKFKSSGDSEVLLNSISSWGIKKTLNHLIGMFSFVYYEKETFKIFFARDHFGMKPIFYTLDKDTLIIGSEIKSIFAYTNKKKLNKNSSLNPIFFTGLSPYGKTMFEDINRVMPGEYLTYDINKNYLDKTKYFNCSDLIEKDVYNKIAKLSPAEYEELLRKEIEKSLEMHMISDAKLGVLFSAGLDSSLIGAIASKKANENLEFFKYQSDDLNDDNFSEDFQNKHKINLNVVKNIDKEIIFELPKLIYHLETINKSDSTPLSKCCALANKMGIKVLLSGDAADEVFGGYNSFTSYILKRKIRNFPKFNFIKKILNKLFPGFSELFSAPLEHIVSPYSTNYLEFYLDMTLHGGDRTTKFLEAANAYNFIQNKVERDCNAFLLDEINSRLERFLIRNDRFGMMESVEIRVPYLTIPLVKIAVNTPYYLKCKFLPSIKSRSLYSNKYILKKIAKIFDVPESIIKRFKIGTPSGAINNQNNKKIFQNWSLKNSAEFLSTDQNCLKTSIDNLSSEIEKDKQIWNLLSLEILIREFIIGDSYEQIIQEFKNIIIDKNYELN
jgi:asparagine synthase (glutamine-hydrolysing)